jgi:hypothetical protein
MTVTAERIEFLACWSDSALAMMANEGYRDDSDELHTATLEELEAVRAHRAEKDAEWIRSLSSEDRAAYVESGELDPDEVAKAMGKLSLAKVPADGLNVGPKVGAKRAATRPVLIAHDETTGAVVNIGDTVTSFRGETAKLYSLNRPKGDGRSGKVSVIWDDRAESVSGIPGNNEYYDGVFNLVVSVVVD